MPPKPKNKKGSSVTTAITYDLTQAETLKLLGLDTMKTELEALGCTVNVSIKTAAMFVTH